MVRCSSESASSLRIGPASFLSSSWLRTPRLDTHREGIISVPQESLKEKFQVQTVTGFGLNAKMIRNQECIATWTIHEIDVHTTNSRGHLIGTLEYGFGSKLRIEGRVSGSILRFKGTKVVEEASQSPVWTDKGCQYYVVPSGTDPKEFLGYWSGCEGSAKGKEGRMFLTLDV